MRTDQYIGLNDWASDFVSKPVMKYTDHIVRAYEDGTVKDWEVTGEACLVESEASGEVFGGMFDEEYSLTRYIMPDGRVFTEFLQADPWSSGPMFFIALKDERGEVVKESLWTEEEIDDCL